MTKTPESLSAELRAKVAKLVSAHAYPNLFRLDPEGAFLKAHDFDTKTTQLGQTVLAIHALYADLLDRQAAIIKAKSAPDEITEDEIRGRAKSLVLRKGWKPGDKLSAHSVVELMTALGLDLARKPAAGRCAYPECGCDFDAVCEAALTADDTTSDALPSRLGEG